jgi:hypothetical protein
MNGLEASLYTIAPERKQQWDTPRDDFDLIYRSDRPWEASANAKSREIFISRGTVELLWSASLAHHCFYTRLIAGRNFENGVTIDPQSDATVIKSLNLLKWALECQNGSLADDWPDDLPRPIENPVADSDESAADELCRAAAAFILHHEHAHIMLGHPPDVDNQLSISQEKDADIAAAEWVLGSLDDPDNPRYKKRILGMVQTLVLLTAQGLYTKGTRHPFGGTRHPFSYDRLSSLIDRFLAKERHVARTFATSVILLHLNNSGRQFRSQERFTSFGEVLEAACDQLAEEAAILAQQASQSFTV